MAILAAKRWIEGGAINYGYVIVSAWRCLCGAFVRVFLSVPMASQSDTTLQSDEVLERAAELFRLMSAPMRLKIIGALCQGEKNVTELLAHVATTQPNMSQHLTTLYKAGVLGKRRKGL